MRKKIFIIILAMIPSLLLFARYAELDGFLIGGYTYWKTTDHYRAASTRAFYELRKGGYNSSVVEGSFADEKLSEMLFKLHIFDQDAIILDNYWDPRPSNTHSTSILGMSLANHIKYEAEYSAVTDEPADKSIEDQYYYCSPVAYRVGSMAEYPDQVSGNRAWQCNKDKDSAGYAIRDLRGRFKNTNGFYPWLTQEFFFHSSDDKDIREYMLKNDYLDYKVAIRFPDWKGNENNPKDLLRFEIAGRPWSPSGEVSPDEVSIRHSNLSTGAYDLQTKISYRDYNSITETDEFGNKIICLRVMRSDLMNAGLLLDQGGRHVLSNISPRVWWNGNEDFLLDYIEVEDNSYQNLKANYNQNKIKINNRLADLRRIATKNNLTKVLSLDEPNQPQFDAYRNVQDMIDPENPGMFTAMYNRDHELRKTDNPKDKTDYYLHPRAFIDKAKPQTLALDIYPIRNDIAWNPADITDKNSFVQDNLDNMLFSYNSFASEYNGQPNKEYYAIVQSFGRWSRASTPHKWVTWIRPPYQTQTMLQYLPLCYGVDGIINYRTTSAVKENFTTQDRSDYDYAPLCLDSSVLTKGIPNIYRTSNYHALKSANAKILKIGPTIKQLNWKDADCLKIGENAEGINLANALLDDLYIMHTNQQTDDSHYKGYIQCGTYHNKLKLPSYMLVNRRANYRMDGANPLFTDSPNLDACFAAFPPQTVTFVPSRSSHALFGTHVALFDPYDNALYRVQDGSINVELDAGDGKYLQMCSTVPSHVTGNTTLNNLAYLSGLITIDKGAVVTIDPGCSTRILSNSSIHVTEGSTLIFSGTVNIGNNVKIKVTDGGSVNLNNAICVWGQNSVLEVDGASSNVDGSSISEPK